MEDILLDLIVKMQRAIAGLTSASEDHEFSQKERDSMDDKAAGLAISMAMVVTALNEVRNG